MAPRSITCVPEPHQVAVEPLQFDQQHADPLDALRHLEAQQLLDRQHVAERVRVRAQVVHALDERDHLLPLLLLHRLLDAGVQVADGRRDRQHGLAVQLQHQAQHAVRAGVLRPHVDGQHLGAQLRHTAPVRSSSHIACSRVRCTSCTRAVDGDGTLMWMSAAAPTTPPSRPVRATVVSAAAPSRRRTPRARSADPPLVEIPSSTSPGAADRLHLTREDHR